MRACEGVTWDCTNKGGVALIESHVAAVGERTCCGLLYKESVVRPLWCVSVSMERK